ncbi:MAG: amidohydrolase family protein [Alphaproteobacteria bacterium]|nr:MAG: amidohydrolase family protein [Alphaproteobacteria bacterium]
MLARLIAALLMLFAGVPAAAETIVIHAGRLMTDPSRPIQGPSTITVTDGRITAVAPGLSPAPQGARLIDLTTRTVMPGLIDTHVHFMSVPGSAYWRDAVDPDDYLVLVGARNALTTLRAGFTTVRDLGSGGTSGFSLKRAIDEGLVPGPRMLVSGAPLSTIGGHGDVAGFRPEVMAVLDGHNTCTGAEQCAARVRELARAGADVIKFHATGGVLSQGDRHLGQSFTDEEMRSIISTAHALGLKVAAHAHADEGIAAAVRAGVDSIEHGTFASPATIQLMRQRGTTLVPTLMAFVGIRERLGHNVYTPIVESKVRMTLEVVGRAARLAHDAGVPVIFGTDAGVYEHGRNAGEFVELVERAGLTPAEAVAAATTGAAHLLGLDNEVGRIAPGFSADLIAVDGDPIADVRVLQHVGFVMVRGHTVD